MLKTKPAAGLCLCVFVLIVHEALAQDAVSLPTIEHSALIDTRPNEPIRIFGMRLPFRITPIAGPSEIAFDAHFGNTWNPSGLLEYQQADEPYFSKPWEATYHPPYEEVPDRYQFYSADGVIRSAALTWTRKISNRHEFYGALNANMLVGGDSFIDAAVSDLTIENVHRIFLGQHDPFRRLEHRLNAAEMKFTDREGRNMEIKPGRIFLGSVDIGFRHFTDLLRKKTILWNLSIDAQLGVPLHRAREHLSAGALLGTAITKQVAKNYGITLAVGYAAQHDKVFRIRSERFDPGYSAIVTGYRFLLGQNIGFKKRQRLTVGIEMQGLTSPLSTRERVTAPHLCPEDIGVQTSYTPEYWTAARPINITNQRRAGRSLIRGSEYLTLNFSWRSGKTPGSPTVAVYFQEDWTVIYDPEGTGLPLFSQSNNSQDFGVGIKFIKPVL